MYRPGKSDITSHQFVAGIERDGGVPFGADADLRKRNTCVRCGLKHCHFQGGRLNSVYGMKFTSCPSVTSLTSSPTSTKPSDSRNEEISPEPSRGNLATAARPSLPVVNLTRQNSRRPTFFVCENTAGN